MSDSTGLQIVADEPIAGLSDAVERTAGAAPHDRVHALAEAAAAQGVGAPAARGLPDVWNAIVETVLGRRVLRRVDAIEVPVPWMRLHAPTGGTARLKVATTTGSSSGLSFKAVGSGWGSGRSLTLSVNRDFHERNCCMAVVLALRARVTVYEGDVAPRTDVLGVAGLSVEEFRTCPDCSGEHEQQGAMVVPAGEWIDLRRDTAGQTFETTIELSDTSDVDVSIPFTVPGLDPQIGIEFRRRSHVSCTTTYVLPGGRRYRPSAAYGEPADLPFWRCD